MKRIIIAILALLAMAGCATETDYAKDSATPSSAAPSVSTGAQFTMTSQEAATNAECKGFTPDESLELYVKDSGRCVLNGAELHVLTFSTNEARDNYIRIAKQFGGRYFYGDGLAVTSESPAVISWLETNSDLQPA
jgi:hypothetical protein